MQCVVKAIKSLIQITRQPFQPSITIKTLNNSVQLQDSHHIPMQYFLSPLSKLTSEHHKDIPNCLDTIHLQPIISTNTSITWNLYEDVPGLLQGPDLSNIRVSEGHSRFREQKQPQQSSKCTFFTHCKNRLTNGAGILILPRNKSQMVSKATCSPCWEAF